MRDHMISSELAVGAFVGVLAAIPGPNASAQMFGGFAPQQTFSVGVGPASVAMGDLNSDGAVDLAVATGGSFTSPGHTISVLLGDGAGGFAPQQTVSVGAGPVSVEMGDLNSDGAIDIVVANGGSFFSPGHTVSILIGNGAGGFAPQQVVSVGSRPDSVAMGDLNGDGALDLAVANANSNSLSVLLGNGTGSFAGQTTFPTGSGPISVSMGDLNGDGALDLAVANAGAAPNFLGATVSVLLGNGAGGFAGQVTFATGSGAVSVAMGDLNSDGALDLAVANHDSSNVSILLGDGSGGFFPQVAFAAGVGSASVAMGDLDGDGDLDLAVANANSDDVSILLGDGVGGFSPPQAFPVGVSPISIALGDLNGDMAPDVATANFNDNNVAILINQTPFPTGAPADLNGDGVVNGADLATLLTQWGTNGAADLNNDGVVDGADLATLLTNWGPVN